MKKLFYFISIIITSCTSDIDISGFIIDPDPSNDNPKDYQITSVCELSLNRTAKSITSNDLPTIANMGFIWNDNDNETPDYRPQGITDLSFCEKKYVAVTWYGKDDKEDRGVRVSFVDITDMNSISYRHVLLVDENYNTFEDMHGGGLHYLDGSLYVPDTRSDSNNRIYSFDLNDIKRVPDEDLKDFHNYRYIVKRSNIFHLPINPSCISYDWDSEEFIVATFKRSGEIYNPKTTFSWFNTCDQSDITCESSDIDCENLDTICKNLNITCVTPCSPYYSNFFDRAQGIVSKDYNPNSSKKMIWTSQSYGRNNPSYLYATMYNRNSNNNHDQEQIIDTKNLEYNSFKLPPGLEDLHLEKDNNTLWSLTEFGPSESDKINNDRMVLAFSISKILPPE